MRTTTRRHLVATLVGLAGTVLLLVGVLSLWVWDAPVPPTGLIETDLDGLECGAPLDNPGWDTGQPCHGAVNRQTAMGWVLVIMGTASIAAVTLWSRVAPSSPTYSR